MDIYAELGETDRGERILLHGFDANASQPIGPTFFGDKYTIEQIQGRKWHADLKRWSLPVSWPSCVLLRAHFGARLKVGEALGGWARTERQQRDRAVQLRDCVGPIYSYPYDGGNDHSRLLYDFQVAGRDFLVTARHAILGDEMGSGKTIQTLAALRAVNHSEAAYPALVVCPSTLKRNWEREVKKWLPEATPVVIGGSATQRRKQLATVAETNNAVVIINIEALRLHSRVAPYGSHRLKKCLECDPKMGTPDLKVSSCETHNKELNAIEFKVCVIDEAHRVKDPKALQTRAVWHLFHSPSVRYRWALTGTPVANHPGDLWSILHTIAPQDFPTRSAFLERYAVTVMNPFGGMDIRGLNPRHRDEFYGLFDPRFRRMIKAEVLRDLPDKVYLRHDVEMSPKQARAYRDIETSLVTVLEDGTVFAPDGNLAAATRLLQLASAHCDVDKGETPDDPKTWTVVLTDTPASPKVDELMNIIADNPDKPLAIAAEHRQLLDLVAKRFTDNDIHFVRIDGSVSTDERDAAVQAFQDGSVDYVLFTYKAGGVGITLTRADTLVRLQRSWSLVSNTQGEDRIHRIGSEVHESVTIIDLVASDTIEERQINALREKAERLEEIARDRLKLIRLGQPTADLDAEAARLEAAGLMEG